MKPGNVEDCAKNLIQNRPDLTYEQIAQEVKRLTTESVSRSYIGVLARTMNMKRNPSYHPQLLPNDQKCLTTIPEEIEKAQVALDTAFAALQRLKTMIGVK